MRLGVKWCMLFYRYLCDRTKWWYFELFPVWLSTRANNRSVKAQIIALHKDRFLFKMSFLISHSRLAKSQALNPTLSPSLSPFNPTPLTHKLFLHVLLASDPAREEMFCLILKCEVSCQVSLVSDLSGQGGKKKKKEREGRKKMFVLHKTAKSQLCDQS